MVFPAIHMQRLAAPQPSDLGDTTSQADQEDIASPPVPPRFIVSRPAEDDTINSGERRPSGPRRKKHSYKEQGRGVSSDWIDIDDDPKPRRRKKTRRSVHGGQPQKTVSSSQRDRRSKDSELGRFFPRLNQISETTESPAVSRSSTRDPIILRPGGRSSTGKDRSTDVSSVVHRRPTRLKGGGILTRQESLLKINASLLSVISGLTATTDRSSGSNSTITQRSYNQREGDGWRASDVAPRRPNPRLGSTMSHPHRARSPRMPDELLVRRMDDDHDGPSAVSSSASSRYQASDAGSSDAPGTPSSHSTFPSPTFSRRSNAAEMRRKIGSRHGSPTYSRSHSRSPDGSVPRRRKQPSVMDVADDDADDDGNSIAGAPASVESAYKVDRTSSGGQSVEDRLRQQEASLRQHMAYARQQQPHNDLYIHPQIDQHRSQSVSSAASDRALLADQTALQQYQHAAMQQPISHPALNGSFENRPPVPDAPELSQRTIAGYEMLAVELSSPSSPVKPVYRKFEYLNHRLLLHLQDELAELEEQLRTIDEVIAQTASEANEGKTSPASRRGDAYYGAEIHHRRTSLLGRIFVKSEQYNKAMSSYSSMVKDCEPAERIQIQAYQQWMSEHVPIHEIEARFLQHKDDLVVPGRRRPVAEITTWQTALPYASIVLTTPLLLFAVIPTLVGRLLVTALIVTGVSTVAATTGLRNALSPREWTVCGAAYVVLMAAIAGCIPQHSV